MRALREESGRPGRPRRVYTAVYTAVDGPDPELRNYRLLASVLAAHLRAADEPEAAAVAAGERFGAELVEPWRVGETAATLERVVRMLADIGFQPGPADRTAIRLHHCPFHELARDQPDIVCGIHLGLIRGALLQLGAPAEAVGRAVVHDAAPVRRRARAAIHAAPQPMMIGPAQEAGEIWLSVPSRRQLTRALFEVPRLEIHYNRDTNRVARPARRSPPP